MTAALPPPPLRAELDAALAAYLARHPDEAPRLAALTAQLADDGDPFSRGNMRGHVTVSALVLDASGTQVLLVHHRALDRWLQPGGHVEDDATLWAAACREVAEETGVDGLQPLAGGAPAVLDIDSHAIPARPAKGEAAHVHHDLLFAAQAPAGAVLRPQVAEVGAVRWLPLAQAAALQGDRLAHALRKLAR